jgi:Mg/Co/Ni transporter MgtE
LTPETSLAAVTRYFAAYNLVCGPVVEDNRLLGAVSVDDVLDHLLPDDWRVQVEEPELSSTTEGTT